MKITIRNILTTVMLLIMVAGFANAADIVYNFNTNNVRAIVYDCYDSTCTNVSANPWYDQTTTNGILTISFPQTLSQINGYAVYFVSDGYIPHEYHATWAGTGTANYPQINFTQVPLCRAPVTNMYVVNTAYAYEPVVFNITAEVGAEVRSAFTEIDNGVEFVPPMLKDDYYSADVDVQISIFDNTGTIFSDLISFSEINQNPLFMNESINFAYNWTPTNSGQHRFLVTTSVTDNQCANTAVSYQQKQFQVLPQRPLDQCYTIINNPHISNQFPQNGELVTIGYEKISNQVDAFGNYNSVPTNVLITVLKDGVQTTQFSQSLPANQNPFVFESANFSYIVGDGNFDFTLFAIANSPLCTGVNIPDIINQQVIVSNLSNNAPQFVTNIPNQIITEGETLTLTFTATDADNDPLIFSTTFPYGNFVNNFDGSATFTWTTGLNDAGIYDLSVTVSDGLFNQTQTVQITVLDSNQAPVLLHIGNQIINENQTLAFTLNAINSDGDNLTYLGLNLPFGASVFDNGDGQSATFTWTPNFNQAGIYTITVLVSDLNANLLSDSETFTITVLNTNRAPNAINDLISVAEDSYITRTFLVTEPDFESYTTSIVSGPNNGIVTLNGNGYTYTPNPDYTGLDSFTYIATDIYGLQSNVATITINVIPVNDAPTANAGVNQLGFVNQTLTFDGSASFDTDGFITSYVWNMGDGTILTGAIVSHSYSTTGNYTVTLIVTDNSTLTDSDIALVTINNLPSTLQPPVANAGNDFTIYLDQLATLNGALSTDADGTIVSYVWNFGDGTFGNGVTASHNYSTIGTYIATLIVTDNDGLVDLDTVTVTVLEPPFQVSIIATPTAGTAPLEVKFDADVRGGDSPFTYTWDFGDGKTGSGKTPTHIYKFNDEYKVILYVTDANGETKTATKTISVKSATVGTTARSQLYVSTELVNEVSYAGDTLLLRVKLENNGFTTLKDARMTVSIPDLGEIRTFRIGKLSVGDTYTDIVPIEIPFDAYSTEYMLRLSLYANSGDVIRNKYVYFEVKE